jgi:hypothetical protein
LLLTTLTSLSALTALTALTTGVRRLGKHERREQE